ncbi:glycosyltransferase family 4 protein [Polynucleobacter sp. UK-Gri1-W3]|uniref:glycosyltransferase family 4 protein n=1 Tax=Polynucleobacter sp. UK-Gri1-W3 TaxID=1819737 RepID=UPI001C0E4A92|nr:glycosyltransferase family 4 protein [Polynucleobacter sp. UK-Gri1-W3]MBU3538257.1 glycosyltransferase family 4 protein [Polynucleobacter sp. UK-Gri1-W3]
MKSIAVIADSYYPARTSAASQLKDLAAELNKQGISPLVIIPDSGLDQAWKLEVLNGVRVLRLKSPKTKDVGYIRRAAAEFFMPYFMWMRYLMSPLSSEKLDGVIWYSPTIFWAPFVKRLKRNSSCSGYLILRDIFPEWALDLGLMRKGIAYRFFKWIEASQYKIADTIGVQAGKNIEYFKSWPQFNSKNIEVLQNWLSETSPGLCSISVGNTFLAGRNIFVYAGNMGVAQGIGIVLDLAESLLNRADIGFLMVGRGSEYVDLKRQASNRNLNNMIFFDEIDSAEIPALYSQCSIGMVILDSRHKTHNIPGKFLSYMQSGLPVLAKINPGNDLVDLINEANVGSVYTGSSVTELRDIAEALVDKLILVDGMDLRCKNLAKELFSTEVAVKQILTALEV